MRTSNRPIAILCSDIHLQSTPPIARSGEKDWYGAMQRVLDQLINISETLDVPVLCAGDVFNHWSSSPELINFAMAKLPLLFAIPGQHDMPYHSADQMEKSAFHTLELAERIMCPPYGLVSDTLPTGRLQSMLVEDRIRLYGVPFGMEVKPCTISPGLGGRLNVLLLHKYTWIKGYGFTGAPKSANLSNSKKVLATYDVVVIGDNHNGFLTHIESGKRRIPVFNCGSLMRRTADQVGYKPQVGILHWDGSVTVEVLDVSQDVFYVFTPPPVQTGLESIAGDLIQSLVGLSATVPDFGLAVKQALSKMNVRPGVRKAIQAAFEESEQ